VEITHNKSLGYKLLINLMFWCSFGLVSLMIEWSKADFVLAMRPQFHELKNLIQTKQFILMIISGFSLYGLVCLNFRKIKTEIEKTKFEYLKYLALQEWASIFINFGSMVFVAGFLIGNYWYCFGTLICYIFVIWVARE
jgi:hypothetical protein